MRLHKGLINRLTRVNRFNLYAEFIKSAFSVKSDDIIYTQNNINLFVEGLKSANPKVPLHYQPAFSNMIENRTRMLALLKRRSQVRQATLFARIPKVVKLIISGYPKGKRLRHAVRDIIGWVESSLNFNYMLRWKILRPTGNFVIFLLISY